MQFQEGSRGSFSGHHGDPRSFDLLLEPYRWNVQWYQARWWWVDRQARSTYKESSQEMSVYRGRKLVHRTELLFHVTKYFEVKKWVRSKKRQEDVTFTALLQYTKEHEMTVKDFNRHKSSGGFAQLMTINAIEIFKCSKKGSRNGSLNRASSSHRGSTDKCSTDKMCSKCNSTHAYKECPAFGKKCHKCGKKNHFSSCCRLNMSQDKGHQRDRTQTHGRSPERCHWPSRGRCSRSRSWSWSSSESVTHSAHSINWYDIDDINVVKMFHSISRSRMVASKSNDTDPDGKSKIITRLKIKLLQRWVVNNLQIKVDDEAEANILPLCSFRSMFPHAIDGDGYPLEGFLRGSRTMLECYNDSKLVNHGSIMLKLQHYTNNSFQDHQFFVVETPTHKEIIVGHPASVRLGLIKVMCKSIAKSATATEAKPNILTQITDIDGRVPRRWPRRRSEQNSSSCGQKGCKSDSFQDPHSRPSYRNEQRECKISSFQDLLSRPQTGNIRTHNMTRYKSSGSFQDPLSRPLHMYNKESLVISGHKLAEQTQLLEQSTEAPQEDIATEFETHFQTLHIKVDSFQDPGTHSRQRFGQKQKQTDFFQDHG